MSKCLTLITTMKLFILIAALIAAASATQIFAGHSAENYANSAEIYQSGLEQQQRGLYSSHSHGMQAPQEYAGYNEAYHRPAGEKTARILGYEMEHNGHQYKYAYETENGIKAEEAGEISEHGTSAQGAYSYTGDDGHVYTVTYTADEHGFHPQGEHLPTPPPIPDEIQKSIEQNAHDEANGIFDDGKYKEQIVLDTAHGTTHGPSHVPVHGGHASQGISHGAHASQSISHGAHASQGISHGAIHAPIHVPSHSIGQGFSHTTAQAPIHVPAHSIGQAFSHATFQAPSHSFTHGGQAQSHGVAHVQAQPQTHASQAASHGFARANQAVNHGFAQAAAKAVTVTHGPSLGYQNYAGYQTHMYQPPTGHASGVQLAYHG